MPGEGEGLAHGELVVLVLLVKAEGEAEDVGVPMSRRPESRELEDCEEEEADLTCGRRRDWSAFSAIAAWKCKVKSSVLGWPCWAICWKSLLVISDEIPAQCKLFGGRTVSALWY